MARVDKYAVQIALTSTNEFIKWKTEINGLDLAEKGLETRMKYVVSAIIMGITVQTALQLCHVQPDDFKSWTSIQRNMERLTRANATAEAQLEYIIHQYAMLMPEFALQVLSKRNPKRWDTASVTAVEKGVKIGQKLSEMIRDKPSKDEDEFDVTA